jgi:LuxR family maltose regulon positive regulatory protein
MYQELLRTKLVRPSVAPDIVARDRLIKRLNQARNRPLTLISAPAGYGKSTLASRWVAICDCPCAWVSLDNGDDNPRQFLGYLLAAIQQCFPEFDLRNKIFLNADRLPPVDELAKYLLNDLHQIPEPFILVLDDYQCINDPAIHDFIAALLEHPAPAMHLALLTRHDPPFPLAAMRGRGRVTEVRAPDLRFTLHETVTFMGRMLNVVVEDATASLLASKTEGWAAGLRLAGLYLRGRKDMKLRVRELSGRSGYIAEYLAAEVLSRQHPEMIAYLLETSILDRFCAPLCDQMHREPCGKPSELTADQFIQWLVNTNLFVIALDDEGYWFRYHHLFQAFLTGELRKGRAADRIADLHRAAANWFAENDLIEEAIRHRMAAGEATAATQLVLDQRYGLMNASRFFRLYRLLTLLPENTVAENPLLVTTRAFIALERGTHEELHEYTQKALRILQAHSPQSEVYTLFKCEVNVLQSIISTLLGDAETGLVRAQDGLNDLPDNAMLIRSLGFGVLSVCYQMMGNTKRAVTVIKETLSNHIWPDNIRARIHFYLTIVQYMEANLVEAMNASQECLRTIRDLPYFHTRAFANYFLGTGHYLRNEFGAAESFLSKLLDDPDTANPSYVAHAGFILARMYLSQDNEAAAAQVLEQIGVHCRRIGNSTVLSIIQAFEAEFALLRGDFPRARQICMHADFDVRPPLWFFYVPQLTPIKFLLAEGTNDSLKKAHIRLVELDKRMHRINRKNVRIEILSLLAILCHKQSDQAAATEHLQAAMDLAEPQGWLRTFVDLGIPMMDLLKCLIQYQPGQTYAQQVLKACEAARRKNAPSDPDAPARRFVEHPLKNILTRRETEILSLLAEGLSNKEIAARIYIAPVTVKKHLQNIFKKLDARNRLEALKKSREIGVVIRK